MQNELKQIIKEIIAPLFKQNGFKKKANNFAKIFPEFAWTVNIQSSKWNSEDEVEFTINTGIYNEKLFRAINEWEPSNFPMEVESVLRIRINELKNSSQNWYKLSKATNLDEVKKQVEKDIQNVILPYFEQFKTIEDVIRGLENKEELGLYENPHYLTILYEIYGEHDRAQRRINEVYAKTKDHLQKEFIIELANRLGLNVN
ncbi:MULTISPECIES: DUF4304 domain-containing protein [Gottfriedia]|uniref:DUF4304 domain-containing protein n=1 Tax=Gottfriedia solisilvae TaxID=1516104 RepID=A0A8J3EX61_9BACI|nr:DUF4304 domain-containing protein [Gottfriedia solisilvae]GGI11590.1 hypothetical protein GCM10007380_08600 [Gottfriedia solisilvae]